MDNDEKYIVVKSEPNDRPDTGFARTLAYMVVILAVIFTAVVLYFTWRGIYVQDTLIYSWFGSLIAALIGVISVIKKAAHERHKDYRSTYHTTKTYHRQGR